MLLGKPSFQNAGDLFSPALEGLRGDNILSKTLFLILLLTLAQILLRAAQISSENLWRDLRCPSASLKVFVLQIQYKGACRHLDPCCAADVAQGHTNPPCDIQQQQKIMRWNCFSIQPTNNFPQWGIEEEVFFPLFLFFLFFLGGWWQGALWIFAVGNNPGFLVCVMTRSFLN